LTFPGGGESVDPRVSSSPLPVENKSLDTILLESIDRVFSLVGEPAKSTIYSTLRDKYDVPFDEIPFKVEKFSKALTETFGSNAVIFERQIIQLMNEEIERLGREPMVGDNLVDIMKNNQQGVQPGRNRSGNIRLND
jgi:hypothetical protein